MRLLGASHGWTLVSWPGHPSLRTRRPCCSEGQRRPHSRTLPRDPSTAVSCFTVVSRLYQGWLETAKTGVGSEPPPHEKKLWKGALEATPHQPPARPWTSALAHKLVVRELQMHLVSHELAWLMMVGRWLSVKGTGNLAINSDNYLPAGLVRMR